MKHTFAFLAFVCCVVFALPSWASAACPQLAGRYMCPTETSEAEMLVQQKSIDGVEVYTFTVNHEPTDYITDGQTRTSIEEGEGDTVAVFEVTSTCEPDGRLRVRAEQTEKEASGSEIMNAVVTQILAKNRIGIEIEAYFSINRTPEQRGVIQCRDVN